MVDPLKVFWVLTNSSYLGKARLEGKIFKRFLMKTNDSNYSRLSKEVSGAQTFCGWSCGEKLSGP
jgi:hypothetical protein